MNTELKTEKLTQGDGRRWSINDMIKVMMDVAKTSLQMLERDLFKQLAKS